MPAEKERLVRKFKADPRVKNPWGLANAIEAHRKRAARVGRHLREKKRKG